MLAATTSACMPASRAAFISGSAVTYVLIPASPVAATPVRRGWSGPGPEWDRSGTGVGPEWDRVADEQVAALDGPRRPALRLVAG